MEQPTNNLKDLEGLSYKELRRRFPDGSDDPAIAELLRNKKEATIPPKPEKETLIYPDGRAKILKPGEFESMSPAKRREAAVGSTCSHYEHDVPGMSDDD